MLDIPSFRRWETDMLSWMSKREDYRATADSVIEAFGNSPNIEDLITDLDTRIKSLEDSEEIEDRKQRVIAIGLRNKLREALPLWFMEIHLNPAFAYQQFAEKIVQPGDVIITFNYDDSLERELKRAGKWDISRGYGFQIGASASTQVLVLKLHGSINWLVSIFGGITSGSFGMGTNNSLGQCPCIATDFLKYLGYEHMPGTFPGGGGFYSLILPGRTKEFYYQTSFGPEHEEFFSSLWLQGAAALKLADKLVLCGYSLLPVDERACDLVLGVPHKDIKVAVISGRDGQRITQNFFAAGFKNVECHNHGYFETWVTESIQNCSSTHGHERRTV